MISEQQYHQYLLHLLKGERKSCEKIVSSLLKHGISIRLLYTELFQRSMYRVGELWEHNQITVAVEHLATSVTQQLMTLVYPQLFTGEKTGKKSVISCVANEYHQLGSRMVADIFELMHWEGDYLGSNTPVHDLVDFIKANHPNILCLSVSIYFNMPELKNTIEQIRRAGLDLPILVGGQAFRWGGQDIQQQFPDVRLVKSIETLEQMIIGGEI